MLFHFPVVAPIWYCNVYSVLLVLIVVLAYPLSQLIRPNVITPVLPFGTDAVVITFVLSV